MHPSSGFADHTDRNAKALPDRGSATAGDRRETVVQHGGLRQSRQAGGSSPSAQGRGLTNAARQCPVHLSVRAARRPASARTEVISSRLRCEHVGCSTGSDPRVASENKSVYGNSSGFRAIGDNRNFSSVLENQVFDLANFMHSMLAQ